MKARIRKASHYDIFALEAMMMEGYRESTLYPPPLVPHVYVEAHRIIDLGLSFIAETDEEEPQVIGCMLLDVQTWAWNPGVRFLTNVHFYVRQDFRSTKTVNDALVADDLVAIAKGAAEHVGAPLRIDVTFGDRADAKARFVEKAGMVNMGGSFMFFPSRKENAHVEGPPEAEAA